MKVCLVYNPVSGSGTFINYLDYIIHKFQEKNMQIVPYRTGNRENMERMISQLNQEEYKAILVAGGDGTLNQVVNCLMKHNKEIPVGIFPVGTANDYASYFNLPNSVEEMTEILLRENYTYSDVGFVNDRYFINILSLGFLIDVSHKTKLNLKNNLGVLAYYLKGIEELPKFKPIRIKAYNKDFCFSGEIYFMLVTNGKSAGGFKKIAPFASVSDGLFEVLIFKKCPLPAFMQLAIEVLKGEHIHNPNVVYLQANELTVETDADVATDIDGEVGPSFPLTIKSIPQKLRIITG
ncbi:MAG: YegS/Rv2252/BmrU family lipid kinase [Bacillota bacterium]